MLQNWCIAGPRLDSFYSNPSQKWKGSIPGPLSHDKQLCCVPETLFAAPAEKGTSIKNKSPKDQVLGCLHTSCQNAGFSLVAGNNYKSHNRTVIHHCFHCSCHKHKKASSVQQAARQRNCASSRPLPSDQSCPFKFEVLQLTDTKTWFFPKVISGCACHSCHDNSLLI